jgi:hypothetical protein
MQSTNPTTTRISIVNAKRGIKVLLSRPNGVGGFINPMQTTDVPLGGD